MRNIVVAVAVVIVACEQPAPQGPQELTYQNGYAQTTTQANGGYAQRSTSPTYTPTGTSTAAPTTTASATEIAVATAAPVETAAPIQTVPIPLGVATLPPPTPTAIPTPTTTATATPGKTMATPGNGAFQCTSDAQCLLGRCNVQYRRCAYPCKSSELDCKAGNVCSASGLCMPRGAGALGM